MGVYGLWRLLSATGNQVPLETLEGKVLGIDISIWIHQVLQGYQDRFGNPKPNAHLIGLFHRICKLLFYKIKPVFVFDGGVPMLKKDTIALRRKQKSVAKHKAQQMRTELINNLIKHSAVKTVLNTENQNTATDSSEVPINLQNKQQVDDIFKLPDIPSTSKVELNLSNDCDSDSPDELSPRKQTKWVGNIHNVDVSSVEFKALPADVRYEILTDLKETRKQNSWGRLHEMPEESNEFSGYQMKRLLKRRLVQESLESAEQEMGGKTLTLDELDKLLTEQGINTSGRNCTYRIAGDNTTRLIYISDKNEYMKSNIISTNRENAVNNVNKTVEAGPSKTISICDDVNEYELDDDWESDVEITAENDFIFAKETSSDTESEVELNESRPLSKKYFGKNVMNPALTYMLEYSGLTEKQILTLLEQNKKENHKDIENISKVSETGSLKIPDREKEDNSLSEQPLIVISEESQESAKVDSSEIINPFDALKSKLSNSNARTNTNLLPHKTTNIPNNVQVKSNDATVISSTDSDSDDFIEIEDVPIPQVETNINKCVSQQGIQITFRSDEKMDEDMFADVFETPSRELHTEIDSQNTLPCNGSSEKSAETFHREEEISGNEVILEETVVKSSDDAKVQSIVENVDAELKENGTKNTNSIENVNNFPKDNVEAANIKDNANENLSTDDDAMKLSSIPMNEEELLSFQAELEDKQAELMANIGKLERQGIDISDQIRAEAQELLRIFGIPYVVAPMEAEAQCAYLEQIHLTDGTITDDSDIWLFGGQCVYKNFFDNRKKVLQFRSRDIEHHFKLTRNEMIRLALLVGSDYTTGVTGIGPVTALEILAAFPTESDDLLRGLINFYWWMETGRAAGPGKAGLRNKLQKLKIQKGFPSQAVVQAYLFPKVDESKDTFTWGKPNIVLLSDYAKEKFGWDKDKFNKIMEPVLKRLEEKKTQNKIDAYFKLQHVPQSIEMNLSKRVQKAVQRLNNENIEDSACVKNIRKVRKRKKSSDDKCKKESETKKEQPVIDSVEPKVSNVSPSNEKFVEEYIPQREKNKANALKKKLHAIEVLRKSKRGLYKTRKVTRCVRKVRTEAKLSESDSSSS
ncbi:DNA repair protein complementing XP-G cells [Habropoda laboriosa]|uniref:DNA repair protein complementing XP-G cells n=1 Tax=Habropoda laboriosa TaxID=597456 RepID=A0A0L7QXK4_9HYME|nr:PREDICTED: DNA repair protein complementing XP-G cells homolog [Habropoda laboriosa]KOC63306.1 DNA repair protein complementing XP-G cells [Habropoda laboriosa]